MNIGSLCTGYGGLDLAVETVLDARTVWLADNDPGAAKILATRFPDAPNLHDLTATDWSAVEAVDVLTAGYPCQPFSHAGKRGGTADPRHIWPHIAGAVRRLRPRLVVLENVAGHLSLGFGRVLGDLAEIGYDARWVSVRAADVGAPHGRLRVFIAATDTRSERHGGGQDAAAVGRVDGPDASQARQRERARAFAVRGGGTAPSNPDSVDQPRRQTTGFQGETRPSARPATDAAEQRSARATAGSEPAGRNEPQQRRNAAVDADSAGRHRFPQRDSETPPGFAAPCGDDADRRVLAGRRQDGRTAPNTAIECGTDRPVGGDTSGQHERTLARAGRGASAGTASAGVRGSGPAAPVVAWGAYAAAVHRWETTLGRAAPPPTEPGRNGSRLAPRFVEWMMGLPEGWVTDVPGLSRNAQLKALGNGVVPQQAEAALRWLLAPTAVAA